MTEVLTRPGVESLYRGLRMSADEYLELDDDGYRYELIDGVVCMSPSPGRAHQKLITDVAIQIGTFLERHPIGEVMVEVDVRLDDDLVYRPDVVYLSNEKAALCGDRVTVAPDVVVEVISSDSRRYDSETKRADYERYGILEYWLIDPVRRSFVFHQHDGQRYVEAAAAGDRYRSRALPGLDLDLARLTEMF